MSGIGLHFRQAREAMGLSLQEVQQRTKIHAEYLRALEDDRFDQLPSPIYVRAFIRTYAKSLGLDAQMLLGLYDQSVRGGVTAPTENTARQGRIGTRPVGQQTGRFRRTRTDQLGHTQRIRLGDTAPMRGVSQRGRLQQTGRYPQVTGSQQAVNADLQYTGRIPRVSQDTHRLTTANLPVLPSNSEAGTTDAAGQPDSGSIVLSRRGTNINHSPKKGGAPKWVIRVAAVGAILLVSAAALTFVLKDDNQEASNNNSTFTKLIDQGNGTVNAKQAVTPTLSRVETDTSDGNFVGDLYELKGADKITVEIKASQGETQLVYGNEVGQPEARVSMRTGDIYPINKSKFVWFRLSIPSNAEIKVNGNDIDTTAQNLPKSYRIELKK
ncbi:helix-turn-helix domain-containing protein [Polycladomyces subterraneus]|uniref:Helix-turn-helix domain-containing protein n=1 Tax=Polycladomyces subterraneus TaxID=1016997 RepID=A0ABT8INR4_9BACL|nr:helix-turn-helix transcriptional regulator [Polycladomyces subterraneus]MDN4594420.1 helix-turn-helix domain-containing protein [Polycladomyces subterraneus]